jgi:hypothetical protein
MFWHQSFSNFVILSNRPDVSQSGLKIGETAGILMYSSKVAITESSHIFSINVFIELIFTIITSIHKFQCLLNWIEFT